MKKHLEQRRNPSKAFLYIVVGLLAFKGVLSFAGDIQGRGADMSRNQIEIIGDASNTIVEKAQAGMNADGLDEDTSWAFSSIYDEAYTIFSMMEQLGYRVPRPTPAPTASPTPKPTASPTARSLPSIKSPGQLFAQARIQQAAQMHMHVFIYQSTPQSTCFSKIGYCSSDHVLSVTFMDSGKTYYYKDFSQADWESFRTAPSLGTYYNTYIKGKYRRE